MLSYGSLFSGIGGIDLGLDRAGWRCRWQVEIDPFCRKILHKYWPDVKQYGDITALTGDELEPVDLLCGGFPCQDLSYAGKQEGIEGSRSGLWFEYARLIGELRPRYVLIENVPGLLVHEAMRRVVGELARLGYVGVWRSLAASEFGASHLRKRVFIVAYADRGQREQRGRSLAYAGNAERRLSGSDGSGESPDHSTSPRCSGREDGAADSSSPGEDRRRRTQPERGCGPLANTGNGLIQEPGRGPERRDGSGPAGPLTEVGTFAPGPGDPRWPAILRERPDLEPALESPLRRVVDGLPSDMDRVMKDRTKRLSRLGNAVVPQIAEYIGLRLREFAEHENG